MQITKSSKRQQQKQPQQPQQQQSQQQQQQQQQQLQLQQQQQQQQQLQQLQPEEPQNQKASKMFKVSMFSVRRCKLIMALAACLVAALIARCSSKQSAIDDTVSDLKARLELVEEEQILVRNYVKRRLMVIAADVSFQHRPESSLNNHLFAKMVLNAFDLPYAHVVRAINHLKDEIGAPSQAETKPEAAKPNASPEQLQSLRQQRLLEAYGRALEDSQRHSVLIQEEIRRHQERVPNKEGEHSLRLSSMQHWPLEQLAKFEQRLVNGYLEVALSGLKEEA